MFDKYDWSMDSQMKFNWNEFVQIICVTICFVASCGSCTYGCVKDNEQDHRSAMQQKQYEHEIKMKKIEMGCKEDTK